MSESFMIIDEFQKGLLFMDLGKPTHISLSTYDIDMTLFMTEFYEPDIEYDIWYWLSNHTMKLPENVHLHQLNNNHCKFWYIQTPTTVRLIITSCNITYSMTHGCLQSYYSLTCPRSLETLSGSNCTSFNDSTMYKSRETTAKSIGKDYTGSWHRDNRIPKSCKSFFQIFDVTLDANVLKTLQSRVLYNIPNKYNGIENWYMQQSELIIDANNLNLAYLDNIKRTLFIRTELPPSVNTIICYFRTDYTSPRLTVQKEPYKAVYHYKLYMSGNTLLLSSNNFSFHHKQNYELGVLLPINH